MQAPVGAQVPLAGMVDGAGYVPGQRVERLGASLEPLGRPRVDEQAGAPGEQARQLRRCHRHALRGPAGKTARRPPGPGRVLGASCGRPGLKAPVQHRYRVMPHPAQHPPESRREHTRGGVVGDDLGPGCHAPAGQRLGEGGRRGQWVPAALRRHRPRQVAHEVGVDGARNMPLRPGQRARPRVGQVEPAVQHQPLGVLDVSHQVRWLQQGREFHEAAPVSWRRPATRPASGFTPTGVRDATLLSVAASYYP